MKDIFGISNNDLNIQISQAEKAKNVLQVQIGSLEYSKEFGIDIDFFIDENFQFQNESFKSYLIQRLTESNVNVNQVIETLDEFFLKFTFIVGDRETLSGGFIK